MYGRKLWENEVVWKCNKFNCNGNYNINKWSGRAVFVVVDVVIVMVLLLLEMETVPQQHYLPSNNNNNNNGTSLAISQ